MDADSVLSGSHDGGSHDGGSHAAAVRASFDATARTYDRARRQLIPSFDVFYGTALDLALLRNQRPRRILELGAGTGLLSAMVADAAPDAELVLLDDSAEMLAQARERLGDRPGVSFVAGRFDRGLPDGPWDVVISALAIHHLDDVAKRQLYAAVAGSLVAGGAFVNAEQVLGATPAAEAWIDSRWEAAARAAGVSEADLTASRHRMASDRCAPVEPQLAWLREAGLVDVDCYVRHLRFAVMAGWRPGD